jgi:hypothetical protein
VEIVIPGNTGQQKNMMVQLGLHLILNTARQSLGGVGTQTAALAFGGSPTDSTEEYDGTSWTASNNLNINRGELAGGGIQTAALAFGGRYHYRKSHRTI